MMKGFKHILIVLSITFSAGLSAQSSWEVVEDKDGVKVEKMSIECIHPANINKSMESVIFKYTNSNSYAVRVSFNMEKWTGNKCKNCLRMDDDENQGLLTLQAGESVQGSCTQKAKELFSNVRFLNPPPGINQGTFITDIKLTSFTVQNLSE